MFTVDMRQPSTPRGNFPPGIRRLESDWPSELYVTSPEAVSVASLRQAAVGARGMGYLTRARGSDH